MTSVTSVCKPLPLLYRICSSILRKMPSDMSDAAMAESTADEPQSAMGGHQSQNQTLVNDNPWSIQSMLREGHNHYSKTSHEFALQS